MIDLLNGFFGNRAGSGQNGRSADDHELNVATCALLVEIARIDESFTSQETAAILHIL